MTGQLPEGTTAAARSAAHRLVQEKGAAFTTQELVKAAGIALQTFYRYFATKDELLLAVIGEMIAEGAAGYAEAARELPDPIARLRFYITSTLDSLDADGGDSTVARFIVSAHWQLQRMYHYAYVTQPPPTIREDLWQFCLTALGGTRD